jgi:hypothetical protein
MRVKMKVDISGTRDGRPWPQRGEVVEVADQEGADLCAAKMAEPVVDDGVEVSTPPEPESRVAPPLSGPGSGVKAWREYAAEETDSSVEDWAEMSRDEIVERLNTPDVHPNDDPATAEREANADAEVAQARAEQD